MESEDSYLSKYTKSDRNVYLDFKKDYRLIEGSAEFYAINRLPKKYRDYYIKINLLRFSKLNEFAPRRRIYLEGLRDQFIKHGIIK
jgi:hypothetical protein